MIKLIDFEKIYINPKKVNSLIRNIDFRYDIRSIGLYPAKLARELLHKPLNTLENDNGQFYEIILLWNKYGENRIDHIIVNKRYFLKEKEYQQMMFNQKLEKELV